MKSCASVTSLSVMVPTPCVKTSSFTCSSGYVDRTSKMASTEPSTAPPPHDLTLDALARINQLDDSSVSLENILEDNQSTAASRTRGSDVSAAASHDTDLSMLDANLSALNNDNSVYYTPDVSLADDDVTPQSPQVLNATRHRGASSSPVKPSATRSVSGPAVTPKSPGGRTTKSDSFLDEPRQLKYVTLLFMLVIHVHLIEQCMCTTPICLKLAGK